jgi:two-component system, chemotaxis family, CheB/CheR fusion protein
MSDDGGHRRAKIVVGIGASAGGLEALSKFFAQVPADTGLAYVVVTHQAAGRQSLLPELLARHAQIPVAEVAAEVRLEANRIYVAPPGRHLIIRDGRLEPVTPAEDGARLPIDHFFRSLARDQGERAVGIVLSGAGSDGSLGLKEIKHGGGMVMAQTESSAAQADMPRSAIATENVDYVADPELLPGQLLTYVNGAERRLANRDRADEAPASEELEILLAILREHTRHDFSAYKTPTIRRRIERRMNVHQLASIPAYVSLLQNNPAELDLLFKELLIGVTSFFRDPEAFAALDQLLPALLADKTKDSVIRGWIAGCSTGEEAYSLAILIREHLDRSTLDASVQLFATDLDIHAIEQARSGIYPESIAADVGAARLARFFSKEDGYYRIHKQIREMLIFAPQNLIEDPPFTKLDLISCRNLLIYVDSELQQRLIRLFHYALRPGGVLFLGSSETLGQHAELFQVADKRWKLFMARSGGERDRGLRIPAAIARSVVTRASPLAPAPRATELTLAQLAERALMTQLVPPSVLVHERGEIVHVHGRTGLFLEPAPGPQTQANVLGMAREGLQLDLATALRHAIVEGEAVRRDVRVRSNGGFIRVDLHVKRLSQPEPLRGLYIIAFERAEAVVEASTDQASPIQLTPERGAELERELLHAREVHQSVIEQLETTNEELKSTNEELQSTNEELQSANEELETSKEEMQSLNEELHTVNAELHGKIEELSVANDDMKNLLNGTSIATVFLDDQLNIKRFTEHAKKVIRLIGSDVGRPVGDLVSHLRYEALLDDCNNVLRTLVFKEVEVQSNAGAWYLLRIVPYRTAENVIDGLVLTFDDITQVKNLQRETERVLGALTHSPTAVFAQDQELRYLWTSGRLFDCEPDETAGKSDAELLPRPASDAITALKRRVIESEEPLRQRLSLSLAGGKRVYDLHLEPARGADGKLYGITGVITEIEREA